MSSSGCCRIARTVKSCSGSSIVTAASTRKQLVKAFGLTLREAEVLLWVSHGKSNKEIADILDMSPRTVSKHMEQIFNKLAVEKRTSAATLAVKVFGGSDGDVTKPVMSASRKLKG
ncbi:helix-turn-helix transcriptional regulator [Rhizobium terrae]|uniref:helix-turn-helix transcriptional regulator n=1 Tax=Rhizobium terrae TaxID=2171756 RepID=UPI0013C306F7|nr:helix-turn-helix transcriptional regulator [Rhizobium terrae]